MRATDRRQREIKAHIVASILVIEDETPIRENLMRFLRLEGHQVTVAVDGQAGLDAAQAQAPELIFCDYLMPRMNGFQVLQAMQRDSVLRAVPFVVLSASAEPELLSDALKLGASAYVTKPFQLEQLADLLRSLLPEQPGR